MCFDAYLFRRIFPVISLEYYSPFTLNGHVFTKFLGYFLVHQTWDFIPIKYYFCFSATLAFDLVIHLQITMLA